MKSERLLDAMGDIAEHYIEENAPVKKYIPWPTWVAAAACFGIVMGISTLARHNQTPLVNTDPPETSQVLPTETYAPTPDDIYQMILDTTLGPFRLDKEPGDMDAAFEGHTSVIACGTDATGTPFTEFTCQDDSGSPMASVVISEGESGRQVEDVRLYGGLDWKLNGQIGIGSTEEAVRELLPCYHCTVVKNDDIRNQYPDENRTVCEFTLAIEGIGYEVKVTTVYGIVTEISMHTDYQAVPVKVRTEDDFDVFGPIRLDMTFGQVRAAFGSPDAEEELGFGELYENANSVRWTYFNSETQDPMLNLYFSSELQGDSFSNYVLTDIYYYGGLSFPFHGITMETTEEELYNMLFNVYFGPSSDVQIFTQQDGYMEFGIFMENGKINYMYLVKQYHTGPFVDITDTNDWKPCSDDLYKYYYLPVYDRFSVGNHPFLLRLPESWRDDSCVMLMRSREENLKLYLVSTKLMEQIARYTGGLESFVFREEYILYICAVPKGEAPKGEMVLFAQTDDYDYYYGTPEMERLFSTEYAAVRDGFLESLGQDYYDSLVNEFATHDPVAEGIIIPVNSR